MGVKAEIEALVSKGYEFICKVYIPKKLEESMSFEAHEYETQSM